MAQKFFSLETPDSLHKERFWAAAGFGAVVYGGATVWLNQAWYAEHPRSDFHFFNDNDQWGQMDKSGHIFTAYMDARLCAAAARWTGLAPRKAAWLGFGLGNLLQGTFEIMDGFSSEYGFSSGDVVCNAIGSGAFLAQQLAWGEQRAGFKMSAFPVRYSAQPIPSVDFPGLTTTLKDRADQIYGTGPVNLFLKNYNTLTIWLVAGPRSFFPSSRFPKWLNVAIGHGGNNLFVGDPKYEWRDPKQGNALFRIDPVQFPRERQLYLSLDVDLKKLGVKNRFLRTVLGIVDIVKIPAPALEWNSRRGLIFHPIQF